MKAILKDGRLKYQTQYKVIYDLEGNQQSTIGATEEQWAEWGFKEVVIPEITDTQKLGEYYETLTEITMYVIDKTPEEIASDVLQAEEQAQYVLDTDEYAQQENKYMADGEMLYKRIKYEVRRRLASAFLTEAQFNTVREFLRPATLPLTTGDWDIAKGLVDALPIPGDTTLLAVLDWVKDKIDTYIVDNSIIII